MCATNRTSATRPKTMRVLQTRKDKGSVGSGMDESGGMRDTRNQGVEAKESGVMEEEDRIDLLDAMDSWPHPSLPTLLWGRIVGGSRVKLGTRDARFGGKLWWLWWLC